MSIPPPHHTCDRTKDRRESSGAPRVHFPLQRGKRLSFCFCVLDLKRWADAGGSFLDPPPPFAVHERKTSGGARGQTAWNADAATWASVSDASFSIGAFSRRKWKTRFQWQVLNSILMRLVGSKVKTSVSRGPSGGVFYFFTGTEGRDLETVETSRSSVSSSRFAAKWMLQR